MPPALSDYDCFSDSDPGPDESPAAERPGASEDFSQVEEPLVVEETPAEAFRRDSSSEPSPLSKPQHKPGTRSKPLSTPRHQVSSSSKKRKRAGLLAGLDLDNIIVPHSTPNSDEIENSVESSAPTSAPTSSYNIRARSTSRFILYNQKYHPMDDFLRPSHAAQVRAEHGCISDSEVTDHDSSSDSCSDSDVDKRPSKKRKRSSRRGTRRTSRRVNHHALYNMNRHPQDSDLNRLEIESDEDSVTIQHNKSDDIPVVEVGDEDESSDYNVEFDEFMTGQQAGNPNPRSDSSTHSPAVINTADNNLDLSDDTGLGTEVEDSADNEDFDTKSPTTRRHFDANRSSIIVYEETLGAQLARERSLGQPNDPINDGDKDKENEDPQLEDDDSIDRTIVETMSEYLARHRNEAIFEEGSPLDDGMMPLLDGVMDDADSFHYLSPSTFRSASRDHEDATSQVSTPRVVLGDITSLT